MTNVYRLLCLGICLSFCSASAALAGSAISINYGVVKSVQTVKQEGKHAGGAVVGGVMGALIGPRRHRGIRVLAGAGIGAAVQGSATKGTLQQYSVDLVSGGTTIISTEQLEIRIGDCVSVEQGEHANIRRVSSYHCETKTSSSSPAHHISAASNCQKSKNELANAQTDDAITNAAKKVRILCED